MNAMLRAAGEFIELQDLPALKNIDLEAAFARLKMLYDEVDARNKRNVAHLDLPCHRGCRSCCEDAVFATPLEFYYLWNDCQQRLNENTRRTIVHLAQRIYYENRNCIQKMDEPLLKGQKNHCKTAAELHFSCPLLDKQGACQAYGARELAGRLFGASFNEQQGIYGCQLVGKHLARREVTLIAAEATSRRLSFLPLTETSQVLPAFWVQLYGEGDPAEFLNATKSEKKDSLFILQE